MDKQKVTVHGRGTVAILIYRTCMLPQEGWQVISSEARNGDKEDVAGWANPLGDMVAARHRMGHAPGVMGMHYSGVTPRAAGWLIRRQQYRGKGASEHDPDTRCSRPSGSAPLGVWPVNDGVVNNKKK